MVMGLRASAWRRRAPAALLVMMSSVLAAAHNPCAGASLNCSLLPATDCKGGDIGHQAAATPTDCCAICSANSACSAFAHNAALTPPTCFVKSGCRATAPAPSPTTAGLVLRPPPKSPCIGSIFMTMEGVKTKVFVMQSGGGTDTVELGEDSITLQHGGLRVYLTRTCNGSFGPSSRRRDCHFDDTPCLSLLKHLIKV